MFSSRRKSVSISKDDHHFRCGVGDGEVTESKFYEQVNKRDEFSFEPPTWKVGHTYLRGTIKDVRPVKFIDLDKVATDRFGELQALLESRSGASYVGNSAQTARETTQGRGLTITAEAEVGLERNRGTVNAHSSHSITTGPRRLPDRSIIDNELLVAFQINNVFKEYIAALDDYLDGNRSDFEESKVIKEICAEYETTQDLKIVIKWIDAGLAGNYNASSRLVTKVNLVIKWPSKTEIVNCGIKKSEFFQYRFGQKRAGIAKALDTLEETVVKTQETTTPSFFQQATQLLYPPTIFSCPIRVGVIGSIASGKTSVAYVFGFLVLRDNFSEPEDGFQMPRTPFDKSVASRTTSDSRDVKYNSKLIDAVFQLVDTPGESADKALQGDSGNNVNVIVCSATELFVDAETLRPDPNFSKTLPHAKGAMMVLITKVDEVFFQPTSNVLPKDHEIPEAIRTLEDNIQKVWHTDVETYSVKMTRMKSALAEKYPKRYVFEFVETPIYYPARVEKLQRSYYLSDPKHYKDCLRRWIDLFQEVLHRCSGTIKSNSSSS